MNRSFSAAVTKEDGEVDCWNRFEDAAMLWTKLFEAGYEVVEELSSKSIKKTLCDAHKTDDPNGNNVLAE